MRRLGDACEQKWRRREERKKKKSRTCAIFVVVSEADSLSGFVDTAAAYRSYVQLRAMKRECGGQNVPVHCPPFVQERLAPCYLLPLRAPNARKAISAASPFRFPSIVRHLTFCLEAGSQKMSISRAIISRHKPPTTLSLTRPCSDNGSIFSPFPGL